MDGGQQKGKIISPILYNYIRSSYIVCNNGKAICIIFWGNIHTTNKKLYHAIKF